MNNQQLHKAQISILYGLRRSTSARFSELMAPTGLESDTFKFHLSKLQKLGYVEKLSTGQYRLTSQGKEFANNLDSRVLHIQKQPKLSLLIVATRSNGVNQELLLLQERHRNPYWGFWGFVGGPIPWGVPPEVAAAQEFKKQTNLDASFETRAFLRQRDYLAESDQLLEDKLFTILVAQGFTGALSNTWSGGRNAWMTTDMLRTKDKHFANTFEILEMLQQDITYRTSDIHYHKTEY